MVYLDWTFESSTFVDSLIIILTIRILANCSREIVKVYSFYKRRKDYKLFRNNTDDIETTNIDSDRRQAVDNAYKKAEERYFAYLEERQKLRKKKEKFKKRDKMMKKKSDNERNDGELVIHHYVHREEDIIETAEKFNKYFEQLNESKQNIYQNKSSDESPIEDSKNTGDSFIVTVHNEETMDQDYFVNDEEANRDSNIFVGDDDIGNVNDNLGNVNDEEANSASNLNDEEANRFVGDDYLGNVKHFSSRGRQIFQSTRYPQKEFLTYTKKNIKKI